MTYSIPALIAYNLAELRRHMLNVGATEQQWREGLVSAEWVSRWEEQEKLRRRTDPENLEPYGAQNHEAP